MDLADIAQKCINSVARLNELLSDWPEANSLQAIVDDAKWEANFHTKLANNQ